MPADLTWEPVQPKHVKDVVALERAAFATTDPDFGVHQLAPWAWDAQDYLDCLEEDGTRGWLLFEGTELVAVFVYELFPDRFDVRRLVVHPDYRRAGFATLCLQRLHLRCAKRKRRRTITAHVDEHRDELLDFFRRLHFRPSLARDHFGPGKDAVRFSFTVAPNPVQSPDGEIAF